MLVNSFFILLIFLFTSFQDHVVGSQVIVPVSCPNGILERKEYRELTLSEWNVYLDALFSLQNNPSPDGKSYSEYDYFTFLHLNFMSIAHNVAQFFPWHRAFVLLLEQRLQKINPLVTIPYWDWAYDWESPLESPIFTPSYGMDVTIGPLGDCRYKRALPTLHCLIRDYDVLNFTTFYSTKAIDRIGNRHKGDYQSWEKLVEGVPHNLIHLSIGGDSLLGDMALMSSPNDPIFWPHHSYMDKIWWKWQLSSPSNQKAYGGLNGARPVSLDDIIEPFNVSVRDIMNTERLCYRYSSRVMEEPERENQPLPGRKKRKGTKGNKKVTLPKALNEDWIRHHGWNVDQVRQMEDEFTNNNIL